MNRSRRSAFASFLLYWVALGGASCAPSNDEAVGLRGPAAESAVYGVFPEVAPRWTEWPYRFEGARREGGREVFATPMSSLPKAISVEVPLSASEPVVVKGHDGFALRVWDEARRGTAELTASGLTYGRAGGGTSFWTARESGAEEWLFLPEGATSLEVARYRIEGGRPRQHDWAIDVYDEANTPRVTITAPQVFATDGQRVDARMVLAGDVASVVLTRWVDGPLLVDPVFVAAGDMSGDRKWHEALLLPSGRVMVLGGYHQIGLSSTDLATMELFDPATATWTNGPSAASPRLYPTATILNDGRVLVVSETLSGPQPWTQIYDEQLNSWWLPAQSIDEHATHLAMKLSDDRVLVTGGIPLGKKSEIYDPTANAWTQVAPTNGVHADQDLRMLPGGDAVTVGGPLVEAYSPGANSWTARATPIYRHERHATEALSNGMFVASGGTPIASGLTWGHGTQLYDVQTDTWTQLASTVTRRDGVPLSLLKDESLLLAGGYNGNSVVFASSEVYSFSTDSWAPGPTLIQARAGHSQTVLMDGRVLVAGGTDLNTTLNSAELLTASLPNGAPCASSLDCISFLCVDSVCCNAPCAGVCMACSVAAGAAQDGLCSAVTNVPCDDGDACTSADSCNAGVCAGVAMTCPDNPQECIGRAACDPMTGTCVSDPLADGVACSAGTCFGGVCVDGGGGGGAGGSASTGVGGDAGGGGAGQGGGTGGEAGQGGVSGRGGGGGGMTTSVGGERAAVSASSGGAAGGGGGDADATGSASTAGGSRSMSDEGGSCACRAGAREEQPWNEFALILGGVVVLVRRCRRRLSQRTTKLFIAGAKEAEQC